MTRPLTSDELLYMRSPNQASILKLAFPASNILYHAIINQTFLTLDSVVEIAYTGDDCSSCPANFTLWIGTHYEQNDIGIARIRSADGTKIYIGETSDLNLSNGLFLTIVSDVLPWARHLNSTGDITCDMDWDIPYNDEYVNMNPVINMGADFVKYIFDADVNGGNPVTVDFDASGSFTLDGGTITYQWGYLGSNISVTGDTTITPEFTITAPGTYKIYCDGLSSTGKHTIGWRTIIIYDKSNPPISQFVLSQMPQASKDEGGWSFEVTLYDQAAIAQVQDRQQVILFARDFYGDITSLTSDDITFVATGKEIHITAGFSVFVEGQTIQISGSELNDGLYTLASVSSSVMVVNEPIQDGGAWAGITIRVLHSVTEISLSPVEGRENIVCMGWIDKDTLKYNPDGSTVTFMVYGLHHWLDKITKFILGIEDWDGTPDDSRTTSWYEFINLTVDRGLFALLYWQSTTMFFTDVYLTDDTRPLPSIEAQEGSLWEQIKVFSWDAILAIPLCNCLNQLYVEIDPQIVPTPRPFPVVMDVLKEDCEKSYTEIARTINPVTSRVSASGVEYSWGSNGIGIARLAFAPGHVFKRFGKTETLEKLLVGDQAQLNSMAGLYIAKLNNSYASNTLRLLQNNRFIDICPRQYFHLTRDASENPRGIDFDYDIIPTRVTRNFDVKTGLISVDLEGEAAVDEDLSITGTVPIVTPPNTPPAPSITFPGYTPFPWSVPVIPGADITSLIMLTRDAVTAQSSPAYVSWTGYSLSGTAFDFNLAAPTILNVLEQGYYMIYATTDVNSSIPQGFAAPVWYWETLRLEVSNSYWNVSYDTDTSMYGIKDPSSVYTLWRTAMLSMPLPLKAGSILKVKTICNWFVDYFSNTRLYVVKLASFNGIITGGGTP